MNIENLKKKLTSRKFWIAVLGVVVGIIALIRGEDTAAAIASASSVIAYCIGEGLADAAHAQIESDSDTEDEDAE